MPPRITSDRFGLLPDGTAVDVYSISNGRIELRALTYGGIISSLRVPDRNGRISDVVLGHDSLEGYLLNEPYLGALVGRCANRIANGRFELDGVAYQLATNDRGNHLHGGEHGFDRQMWSAAPIDQLDVLGVRLTRVSPSSEENYPGTLKAAVTYLVDSDDTVVLEYQAVTDAPTVVNLTQHTYFNLAGEQSDSILSHQLSIQAQHYTPVDPHLIPTGDIAAVDGTAFDVREPVVIAEALARHDEQLQFAGGFDHNFVLAEANRSLQPAAELYDRASGRHLTISTTEPGLQFYGGQLLDGRIGAYGRSLKPNCGLCLETQHFPDSPNHPAFPSVTLRPNQIYRSLTSWHFDIRPR